MKSILVPVEEHRLIQPVLETALLLGRALDGYLEGMAITPNLPPYIASDLAIGCKRDEGGFSQFPIVGLLGPILRF